MRHGHCQRELHPCIKVMVKRRAVVCCAWEETDSILLLVHRHPQTMEVCDFSGFCVFMAVQITPREEKGLEMCCVLQVAAPPGDEGVMYPTIARSMPLSPGHHQGNSRFLDSYGVDEYLLAKTPHNLVKAQHVAVKARPS